MTKIKSELLGLLSDTHERHLARFEKVLRKRKEQPYEKLIVEPLMRSETGSVRRDGVLNLPARCDFGQVGSQGLREKNLSLQDIQADRQGYFEIGGLGDVWVSPFAWNALDVQFRLNTEWPNFKPMRNWYLGWSLPEQKRRALTLGVLHRLSGPTPSAGGWLLSLDLGTAPPRAVIELMGTLSEIGASNVSLGACVSVDVS